MTFTVVPASLDGFAKQVDRAGSDAHAIAGYLYRYPPPRGSFSSGGLMAVVGDSGPRAFEAARKGLNDAGTILANDRYGLTGAATYYRRSDETAVARLDATLPDLPDRTVPTPLEAARAANVCSPSFADSRDPSSRLTPVDDVELSHPLSALDNISISHWAIKGIEKVFGRDILAEVTDFFLGDWGALAKAGRALGRAADAASDCGYNVQGGMMALRPQWQGRAAEAADQHFTRIAGGLDAIGHPMRVVSEQFAVAAQGIYNAGESITGIIKGLIDAAIVAGIAAAAGTITAETGIGAIVGYGVAAIEVAQMLKLWADATAVMNNIYAATQAVIGVAQAAVSRLEHAQVSGVSGGSYHHPLVPAGPPS